MALDMLCYVVEVTGDGSGVFLAALNPVHAAASMRCNRPSPAAVGGNITEQITKQQTQGCGTGTLLALIGSYVSASGQRLNAGVRKIPAASGSRSTGDVSLCQ